MKPNAMKPNAMKPNASNDLGPSNELKPGDELTPEETSGLIPISRRQYLDKLNEALGDYRKQGLVFFEGPNHMHPGDIDWLRGPEVDRIYIAAMEQVESRYRVIPEDIVPDNVGRAFGKPDSIVPGK